MLKLRGLTIQIVNYNTKSYLKECLQTLLKDLAGAHFTWEINVLDNDSQDDLSDLQVQYASVSQVHFYFSKKNLGFGGGHNFLAKEAQGNYILLLNPDIKFIEDSTTPRLWQRITGDKKIKVVGPLLLTGNNVVQMWDHRDREIMNFQIRPCRKKHEVPIKVAWVSGTVFLIEKRIFNQVEGFDEGFFLYKEEEDLCLRIRKLGGEVIYDPTIKVFHYGSVMAKKEVYMVKSIEYFNKKHRRTNLS